MTNVEDIWWLPALAPPTTNNYVELGRIFEEDDLRDQIADSEPTDRVVLLVQQADKYALNDWDDDLVLYQLATDAVLDPLIQLELDVCFFNERVSVSRHSASICTPPGSTPNGSPKLSFMTGWQTGPLRHIQKK